MSGSANIEYQQLLFILFWMARTPLLTIHHKDGTSANLQLAAASSLLMG